jgi:hypothetical protein
MSNDPGADFASRWRSVVSDQYLTAQGNVRVRKKLAKLWASACSCNLMALAAKREQGNRVPSPRFCPL